MDDTNITTHPVDVLNNAIEHARGVLELVAQGLADETIEAHGYISTEGLVAVLNAAIEQLEGAGEIAKALPRSA